MITHAHSEIVKASPGSSSRIRHRNGLTERAWKDAEQGLGKVFKENFPMIGVRLVRGLVTAM